MAWWDAVVKWRQVNCVIKKHCQTTLSLSINNMTLSTLSNNDKRHCQVRRGWVVQSMIHLKWHTAPSLLPVDYETSYSMMGPMTTEKKALYFRKPSHQRISRSGFPVHQESWTRWRWSSSRDGETRPRRDSRHEDVERRSPWYACGCIPGI